MVDEAGREGRPREWERLSSEEGEDFGIFKVRSDRSRSPRTDEVAEFTVAESPDGVTVIALTDAGELVMVEQFRHALRTLTLETPSGFLNEGESPVEGALRELREETGFEGGGARVIGCLELNPSWQTTRVHVVQVTGARRTTERRQDAEEDIRVLTLPRAGVLERARTGGIRAAVAVSALALMEWAGQ